MCFEDFDDVCLKLLELYTVSITDRCNLPFWIEKPLMSNNLIFPKGCRRDLSFFLPYQEGPLDSSRLA